MPEKSERTKSLFRKSIQKVSASGDISKQVTFDLSPWTFEAEDGSGSKSGLTLQITVAKFMGKTAGRKFINIDPTDKEVREAIREVFAVVDKQKK